MNGPNAALMELYGTDAYYMHKCGALSDVAYAALRGLAMPASIMAARADRKHQDELLFEAEQLNQQFRMAQSRRMASVVDSLGGPSDPMHAYEHVKTSSALNPELEKVARELGCSLAEMEKEALNLGALAGGLKSLAGKATAGVGNLLQRGGAKAVSSGSAGRMLQAGGSAGTKMPAMQRLGQTAIKGGAGLTQKGTSMAQQGAAQAAQANAAAAKATAAKATAGLKPTPGVGPKPPSTPGAAGMTGAPVPGPAPAPIATSTAGVTPPPGAAAAANAPAPAVTAAGVVSPGAATAAPAAAAKKPLIGTGTKVGLGLLGAGAIGTAGVLGHTGLTAARDYMMVPSTRGGQTWGGYGPSPTQNVNQYGYVQPRF